MRNDEDPKQEEECEGPRALVGPEEVTGGQPGRDLGAAEAAGLQKEKVGAGLGQRLVRKGKSRSQRRPCQDVAL